MKNRLPAASWAWLICFLTLPTGGAAQSDFDLFLTRAERTEFRETTRYEEVMDLSRRLAEQSPDIHMTSFGYTNEGRSLPLLVIGAPDASPESVIATGKTRVYVQGNIHAGEVCGKEALLMLLRRFASGEYPGWTDSLVLLSFYNKLRQKGVDLLGGRATERYLFPYAYEEISNGFRLDDILQYGSLPAVHGREPAAAAPPGAGPTDRAGRGRLQSIVPGRKERRVHYRSPHGQQPP